MKNIFKVAVIGLVSTVGLSSCNDFFDAIPGEQYDLESTFASKTKTEEFLNNVYSYVPDETYERGSTNGKSGIWTTGSLETNLTWGNYGSDWVAGTVYASSSWINYWYIEYYKGISKASTFITNVDNCAEATETERKRWKAQARALRAYYYFMVLRSYGPCVLLGEEALALDTPLEDLLKERNTFDDCVDFIADEFDAAAEDLPTTYRGADLGRMDRGACKAFKAKLLLYAASPLFNCNTDYASVTNTDGTQLFSQDTSQEQTKWERARDAYKEFFDEFVPGTYSLYTTTNSSGQVDFYESYRKVTSGLFYDDTNKEQIFVRLADHTYRSYETTPYHNGYDSGIKGGLGYGVPQEMVDQYFTKDGLRIVDDETYQNDYEYDGVPDADKYGWDTDYVNDRNTSRIYFKSNTGATLKQWANREPRFYANITFNGSLWLNTTTGSGEVTTILTYNGNSGVSAASHDAPIEGYGMRKMAIESGNWSSESLHCATLLRLADMYLGYAETLSACGDRDGAMEYVNAVRARAGIPGYGNGSGTDENGFSYIPYTDTRDEVDKRIHRERIVELMFEWNYFFDVRRWKVADMSVGDDWHYPSYHRGGEGGEVHGMSYRADAPSFFEKTVTETRVFGTRHYLFPIPEEDIRRNDKMVQNYGWSTAEAEDGVEE